MGQDTVTLVSDLMSKLVIAVRPQDTVRLATTRVLEEKVSAVPVLDEDGRPVGLLSLVDLLRAARLAESATTNELMTGRMVAVHEAASLPTAIATMANERVHRLIVVDAAGVAVGILSAMDVVCWVANEGGHSVTD